MEQLSCHRTDSYEIWYLSIFRKSVAKVQIIRGDSLARGPKILSIKNYVNQLKDDEITTGYYQQDGATCHAWEKLKVFLKTELSQKNFGLPDLPI